MKRNFLLMLWFVLLAGGRLFADVVTLKDGRQISGAVESGNTQELHVRVGGQLQTVDIDQLRAIQFSAPPPASSEPKKAAGRGRHGLAPGTAAPVLGLFICLAAAVWSRKASEGSRP